MIEATSLKNGTTFFLNGNPYKVVKYSLSKIARGGGTVKLSVRNLENGQLEQKTLSSNTKVDEITTTKKSLQYLFKDGNTATFMDPKSFEQVEVPLGIIKNEIRFIKEGENVDVLFLNEKALSIEIAAKVTLEVFETTPGVKGNTATNVFKPAKFENGLEIKVPMFIKKGDKVRLDTRTSKYVERAK